MRDPENPRSFYPRFNLEDTSSFNDLDDHRLPKNSYHILFQNEVLTVILWDEHFLLSFFLHFFAFQYEVDVSCKVLKIFLLRCSKDVLKRLYYDYYFHRQEDLWRKNALKTLPVLLDSSDMLACGEDLGLIPSCVHPVWLNYNWSSFWNAHTHLHGINHVVNRQNCFLGENVLLSKNTSSTCTSGRSTN